MDQEYAGGAKQTTLTGDVSAGATSFTVDDATGYPNSATVPHVVVLDVEMSNEEKILVTRVGNTFTVVTRGYDDTTAQSHTAPSTVNHCIDSATLQRANDMANNPQSTLLRAYEDYTDTAESTTSTSYVDLTTYGSALDVAFPASGRLIITSTVGITATASAFGHATVAVFGEDGMGGFTTTLRAAADAASVSATGDTGTRSRTFVQTGTPGGLARVVQMYRSSTGASCTFYRRSLVVVPSL